MKKTKLEWIISYIRELKEEAPTNSSGTGGFSSSSNPKGPVAGYDPVIDKKMEKRKRPRYIWTKGIRKRWKQNGES